MSHRGRMLVVGVALVATVAVLGRSRARVAAPPPRPAAPAVALPRHTVPVYRLPVGTSPAIGPADALVTIVVFGDLECQFTRRALPLLRKLQAAQPKDVRVVFKHFPLRFHPGARSAALAAAEAHAQGRFWPFLDAVFKGSMSITTAQLVLAEASARLRAKSVTAALGSATRGAAVDADVALGGSAGVSGTPSVYLNGTYAGGALTEAQFQTFLQREEKRARQLLLVKGVTRRNLHDLIVASGTSQPAAATTTFARVGPAPTLPQPHLARGRVAVAVGAGPARPVATTLLGAPSVGPDDALVTIVLYTNFRCYYSEYVMQAFEEMRRELPGMFKLYFKFHAVNRNDAQPLQAAQAALAAHAQGKFWEYAEILFRNRWRLDPQSLEGYATELDLDLVAFKAALQKGSYLPPILKDVEESAKAVGSTYQCPVVWFNGQTMQGYLSTYSLKDRFRQAANEVKGMRLRPLL